LFKVAQNYAAIPDEHGSIGIQGGDVK